MCCAAAAAQGKETGGQPVAITRMQVHRVPLRLRAPFTTSFGTYETLNRPFVVIETSDGLRGVGEVPTLLDPAYKA
ncbi:MAG: hypothetical protein K0Q71_2122, partial [Thermomicrobiales bacterium]|nr:hypothetical protein [Thermomicrobiales bacterium]